MKLRLLIIFFLTFTSFCNAQQDIVGYTTIENQNQQAEVYLTQLQYGQTSEVDSQIVLAKSSVGPNGFFSFDNELFSEQDLPYQLGFEHVSKTENEELKKTLVQYQQFIHANKDTILFKKVKQPFGQYSTTNEADKEWRRLRDFEAKLDTTDGVENLEHYLLQTRGFIKDSLQILLVKLIGINRLEEKQLLKKDIREHRKYYVELLAQFRESELAPGSYAQFERSVMQFEKAHLQQKYGVSLGLNILGLFFVLGLGAVFLNYRKAHHTKIPSVLSKQENVIKSLILSGKSNKEIATELFISVSTVKTHITNIYNKLHVSGRKELLLRK